MSFPRALSDFPTGREISYRRFDELGNVEDTIAIDVDTVRNTKAVNQARELLARGGGSIKMEYMSSASISDVHTLIALLEAEQDWKPDILIVDYVEMMYLDPRMQRRDAIFETYKGLRDIADEYNLACITASQPNRINMDRRIRSGTALAEDIRKQLENRIIDTEVALNFISGTGKEHMALLSAVLKMGLGIRMMSLTPNGIQEV